MPKKWNIKCNTKKVAEKTRNNNLDRKKRHQTKLGDVGGTWWRVGGADNMMRTGLWLLVTFTPFSRPVLRGGRESRARLLGTRRRPWQRPRSPATTAARATTVGDERLVRDVMRCLTVLRALKTTVVPATTGTKARIAIDDDYIISELRNRRWPEALQRLGQRDQTTGRKLKRICGQHRNAPLSWSSP